MPNWCENELTVYNSNKIEFVLFLNFIKETDNILDFQKIYYIPDNDPDWFDKRIKEWGTKWEINEDNYGFIITDKTFKASFDTAWSPPNELIRKLSEKFPNLKIKLKGWEGGVGFKTIFECKGGIVLIDSETEYHGNRGG